MVKCSTTMMNLLLLLLLAYQLRAIEVLSIVHWGTRGWSISGNITFELLDDYLQETHRKLATRKHVVGNPVLVRQRYDQIPSRWILLDLLGWGNDRTVVLLRGDNIYLVAFQNHSGTWHVLKGYGHLVPNSAVELPFGGSYSDLLGHIQPDQTKPLKGFHMAIPQLTLGRDTFLHAIRTLSSYNPANHPAGNVVLKEALASLIVMICESLRITPIRLRISRGWPGLTTIPRNMCPYVVNWGKMSHRLLCWSEHYPWYPSDDATDLRHINIYSARAALSTVDLILWTTRFKPEDMDTSCLRNR